MESKESGHDGAEGNIIGQFGVGFYSCFMIADHVEVFSQTADASATASGTETHRT